MAVKNQEGTFNIWFAEALCRLRPEWIYGESVLAESIGVLSTAKMDRPDILIHHGNRKPIVIEAKFDSHPGAEKAAIERLGHEVARNVGRMESVLPIVYPEGAATVKSSEEAWRFFESGARLDYGWYSGTGIDHWERWPHSGWLTGDIRDFADFALQCAIPAGSAARVADQVSTVLTDCADSLSSVLTEERKERINAALGRPPGSTRSLHTAVVLWLNAMLIQNRLATQPGSEVKSVHDSSSGSGAGRKLLPRPLIAAWSEILEIDYNAVFRVAHDTLDCGFPTGPMSSALTRIWRDCVQEIESERLHGFIDIAGELFPRMSVDRKQAAAYYTLPETAELLARLAMPTSLRHEPPDGICWEANDVGRKIRLADFACGTGTLLRAGYRRVRSIVESAGGDLSKLHEGMMEEGICGADVSGIAVSLTASGLAAMDVGQPFERPNICQLVVGGKGAKTGSLELLKSSEVLDIFGEALVRQAHGTVEKGHALHARDGKFNFVLMNPPYSASKGGPKNDEGESVHQMFDLEGVSEIDRLKAIKRAGTLAKGTCTNYQAGFGTAFFALAAKKLAPDGRLGIVLPMSAAATPSWAKFRVVLETGFSDVTTVSIVGKSMMSADTGMNEMLVVARKGKKGRGGIKSASLNTDLPHLPAASELARSILAATSGDTHAVYGTIKLGGGGVSSANGLTSSQMGPGWRGQAWARAMSS